MADGSDLFPTNVPATALGLAKGKCASLRDRVARLLAPSKISDSCRRTLLRLLDAELRFLSSLSPSSTSSPFSLNVGYLEAIVHIIEQPSVTRVSRICKAAAPPPPRTSPTQRPWKPVHVDIVCTLGQRPVWFIVSDRNPRHVSWPGNGGLGARVERVVSAARSAVSLKPESVILFFAKGVDEAVSEKLVDEFGASDVGGPFSFLDFRTFEELEGGWVNVVGPSSRAFEIRVSTSDECANRGPVVEVAEGGCVRNEDNLGSSSEFSLLISSLKLGSGGVSNEELINLDTTALIALISGISNGGTDRLLKAAEADVRKRFKGNYDFVMAQVKSELQNPILAELNSVVGGRKGIICESVLSEFKDIVSMCGGTREKARADQLLQSLVVVSDNPSARIIGLPTTRKIALKNKVIFGTGDHWHAPTLTANIGFVRAISQSGMSLLTIEHRPRALIGDWCLHVTCDN